MTSNADRSGRGSASTSHRPFGERPLGPLPYAATDVHRPPSCVVRIVLPVRASMTRTAVLPALPTSLANATVQPGRSEEHTSELQSHSDLVCRLLLENKRAPITHCRKAHEGAATLPSPRLAAPPQP